MLFFRLAFREIRKRPGRALLTLSSIVIGVAAVVAVSFTTQTTRRAFDDIFQTVAGRTSLEVTGPVSTPFDQDVLQTISEVPGVEAASPVIQRIMVIWAPQEIGEDKKARMTVLGIDPERDKAVHDYEIVEGEWFDKEHPAVMLNKSFASSLGVKAGSVIKILTKVKLTPIEAEVRGLFESRNTATTGQGGVLLMPLSVAQVTNKASKKLDSIQIVVKADADIDAVQQDIAARLPSNISVRRPAARNKMAEQASLSTEQGLRMARAFAVLVALFIIINTFLISVTQRRRQMGIMRAIGGTRTQIAKLVYSEALLLGIAGTILGCAVGYFAARYLVAAMGSLYATKLPAISFDPLPFYLAAGFGIGVSLIGATFPALKASRLSPLEAMREVLAVELEGVSRWLIGTGIVVVLIAGALMAATIFGMRPPAWAIWSALIMLLGTALLLTLVLRPLSWLAVTVLRPIMRVEGRLARRELMRHRVRTALTTAAVFIAISTGIGLAINVMDNVQNVKNWYHKAIAADFFVRAMAPDMATGLASDLPEGVGEEIRNVQGLTSIESIRYVSAEAANTQIVIIVRDFDPSHELEFDLLTGDINTIRDRLKQGEVVIGSVLAQDAKLKVGDEIPLVVGSETKNFHIVGIANDYNAGGLTMYLDREVARNLLNIDGVDAYIIHADHSRLDEVRGHLQKIADTSGLMLQSYSDIQSNIDRMMSGVVAGLWAMVVLALVVAAFGVANTLMMTVFEQTRELGMLRILAMTRWQVRKSILAQALIMGLVALVPGIVAGVGVAYLINWAALPVIGHAIPFAFHPDLLVGSALAGLVLVVAAAWVPAERAARLELPLALRYT